MKPVAEAAAGNVGADYAAFAGKRRGEKIKVTAVACKAVHANHQALTCRIAPVGVNDFMKAAGAEAQKMIGSHIAL